MINKRLINTGVEAAPAAFDPLQNFETVTYTGNGGTQKITGYIRKGAAFNGSSSKIILPESTTSSIDSNGAFSISFWVFANSGSLGSTERRMISLFDGIYIWIEIPTNELLRYRVKNSASTTIENTGTTTITENAWHHIVLTGNSTNGIIAYLDGSVEISSASWDGTFLNGSGASRYDYNVIGGQEDDLGSLIRPFLGKIDQVRIFDKALSSSEVITLYGETYASSTKSTTDIFGDSSGVALYELDEDANTTPYYPYGTGAIDAGQGMAFNGTTSIFNFPNTAYETSKTIFTVSGWFKHTSTANNREDIYFGNGATVSSKTGYALFTHYSSGNIALSFRDSDQSQVFYVSSSNIKDGSWHHLCLTYNNGPYVVYLNGASILNGTSPDFINNQTPSYNTYIGNRYGSTGSGASIIGAVDQVRVYSSVLSASEVEALVSETNVPTTNLTAHYKLDGNANDETTNYNGTASNVTYSDPAEFPLIAYNGTPTNVNFLGMAFQPDLVWIKERGGTSNHQLKDSVRGDFALFPNLTLAESATSVLDFESNGFSFTQGDASINNSGDTYVAWCWKAGGTAVSNTDGTIISTVSANQAAGFSIVSYTGTGVSNATVGHGLTDIELVICRSRNTASPWYVNHIDLSSGYNIYLNDTVAQTPLTGSGGIGDLSSSTTTYTCANGANNNENTNALGRNYIAYCFHSVDGYQKVGSYTGGTITSSNIVNLGFRPRWIMFKNTDVAEEWAIYDSIRDTDGQLNLTLYPNLSNAEGVGGNDFTITTTDDGFYWNTTAGSYNRNSQTNIYLAIA